MVKFIQTSIWKKNISNKIKGQKTRNIFATYMKRANFLEFIQRVHTNLQKVHINQLGEKIRTIQMKKRRKAIRS